MTRIVCLHRIPKKIVSDRGSQFTSRFWRSFHENMDMKLSFSSAYHPQTDGQTERTNQVLEDMLRACALQHGGSWEKILPYAEFSYNNSYQASLKMSPLAGSAGLLYIGIRLEKDSSLGLRLFKRQKNKSV
jgi:transposase InsO family protein